MIGTMRTFDKACATTSLSAWTDGEQHRRGERRHGDGVTFGDAREVRFRR